MKLVYIRFLPTLPVGDLFRSPMFLWLKIDWPLTGGNLLKSPKNLRAEADVTDGKVLDNLPVSVIREGNAAKSNRKSAKRPPRVRWLLRQSFSITDSRTRDSFWQRPPSTSALQTRTQSSPKIIDTVASSDNFAVVYKLHAVSSLDKMPEPMILSMASLGVWNSSDLPQQEQRAV